MTRDEIIKLAREADMIDFRDEDSDLHVVQFVDFLASVIGKAVTAEREECAKACEVKAHSCPYPSHGNAAAKLCAQAIRARGEKGQS